MARRTYVAALLPAHNEEEQIELTIRSLLRQTHAPDQILVLADNCTDRTVEIARSIDHRSVRVFETVSNTAKKAGALNQGLAQLSVKVTHVLQMDADTELHPEFIEAALAELGEDEEIGGVCARFVPKPKDELTPFQRLLWLAQRHEYLREDSVRVERRCSTAVLSGTGALFRRSALEEVGGWPEASLVEDYSLSVNLRTIGLSTVVGRRSFCRTDTPTTLGELWKQRLRWYRGTIDELRRYGSIPETRYERAQVQLTFLMLAVQLAFLVAIGLHLSRGQGIQLNLLTLSLPLLMFIDRWYRLRYVPNRSLADVVYTFSPLPDGYQLFRLTCYLRSLWMSYRGKVQAW